MSGRSIIHFRLDSLFARVEQVRNAELVGKPVVIGKMAGNSSGIVVSASPEAKGFGVSEGFSVRHAQRLCPDGVFVQANFGLYREYAHRVFDILADYSPLVEPQSLERVSVDVTASDRLFGGTRKIAVEAVRRIKKKTGLEVAVGVAGSKFVAEAAAFVASPGRIREVKPGMEKQFLAPLPVGLIWGIGEKTERRLADLRVRSMGQLAAIPERLLVRQFGQIGSSFHRLSQGIDFSEVKPAYPFEIINIEQMFDRELEEPDEVREYLPVMVERLALELRKRGRLAEHIMLKLKLASDCGDFPCEVAACRLKRPVSTSGEILTSLGRLLGFAVKPGMKVVGLEIVLSDLVMGEGIQLDLMGTGERRKRLDSALETVKDRFGDKSIFYAVSLAVSGRETVLSRVVV
jgi:DNA polymerase-4